MLSVLPDKIGKAFGNGTLSISSNRNNKLAELINSKYTEDLVEAIRILYCQYLQNKDLTLYMSRIINLLPREDLELKRLCQILISEFAAQANARTSKSQGDVLILATAPIFKDLTNLNTSIKLNALKTLSSLRIQELTPMLFTAIRKIQADKNPLVRRSVALSILKMHDLCSDDVQPDDYNDIINFLLKDTHQTRLYAIYVIFKITGDLSILHKYYFQLIKDLLNFNNFDLERALQLLYQYSVMYFKEGDKDLIKLLDACEILLRLPYPGIVLAISRLYLQFPQESRIKKLIRTVVKFLNIGSESKFIILQMLHQLALSYPQYVKEHYRALSILQIEKLYCKLLKLEILSLLIDENNFNNILEELLYQARSNQPQLVAVAVKLLSKTTIKFPKFIKRTIKSLLDILKTGSSDTKNHVVASFCNLISTQDNKLPLLAICLQNIDDISDIRYKATVIKLLRQEIEQIPTIAAENLRKLSLNFSQQHENVKYEILLLSHQLQTIHQEQQVELLHQYIMTLAKFDSSLLVRDLFRTLAKSVDFKEDNVQEEEKSSAPPVETQKLPIGSLSHLVGIHLPGLKLPTYLNEDTSEKRKAEIIVAPQKVEQPQQQQQQQQQKQQPQSQKQQQTQQVENKKEVLKKVEEDVKKHYQNLDQVLNDFFTD
ncbi:unnamed protein product (macronuclear) [Paramecium tetraurelia]|uniref:Clathrin/coatomer adaptor adaptin-like N-terminal domain-containing protein n=1 Tax=Paramecium tetraurelia TaxID=5888 RepID=A0CWI1_PARTE|nr:uncharacterized protein GSPATT00001351001 [Paramecium tetraurelia]CAK75148.1 unnamed protein product [Paramecium tetraurelia]|eukprot:XP_001442545.1 hypothetical protein (macronuclear) [Paramecium tetraurelia strain d4-2]